MNGNRLVVKGIISMGLLALVLAGIIVIVAKDLEVMKLVVPGVVTLTATAIAGLVGHLNSAGKDDANIQPPQAPVVKTV
jgi:hypothetical protein